MGGDVRQAERRQAAVDVADDLDAVAVEVEEVDGDDAEEHGDERRGHDRRDAAQPEHDRERRDADERA